MSSVMYQKDNTYAKSQRKQAQNLSWIPLIRFQTTMNKNRQIVKEL